MFILKLKQNKAFTLVELLLVVAIVIILLMVGIPFYTNFQVSAQLKEDSAQITQALRLAGTRARAGFNNQNHGVYLNINSLGVDSYTIYQGDDYANRDSDYDFQENLEEIIEMSTSDFVLIGNDVDINFPKISGKPANIGLIKLDHKNGGERFIDLSAEGLVEEFGS